MTRSGSARRLCLGYLFLVIALVIAVSLASFARDRAQVVSNISAWLFIVPFVLGLANTSAGLLAALALVLVGPSLHEQMQALGAVKMQAWSYPGVDAALGFLTAWAVRERFAGVRELSSQLLTWPVLVHGWITVSAIIAIARNLWQSASEFSLRGLTYNGWLVRGISWQDDYYPLQDVYFYSVALALFVSVLVQLRREGRPMVHRLAMTIMLSASANAMFSVWQRVTGKGWVSDDPAVSVNAFWPDLHSFGALMAMALFLSFGVLFNGRLTRCAKVALIAATLTVGFGLYLSGSRSTFFVAAPIFIGAVIWMAVKHRGHLRIILTIAAIGLIAGVNWALDQGYRGFSYQSLYTQLSVLDFNSLNIALKGRPEIWWSALGMYASFPFFGLGQGAFYRLSSITTFSSSKYLVETGGENAHNYFLQTFVELGPLGAVLILACLIPIVRLGKDNFATVSFFGLIGLVVGNIYAHALLVREMLMIAAVLLAMYYWEAEQLKGAVAGFIPRSSRRRVIALCSLLIVLAAADVALSFQRFPFNYAQRCHDPKPLSGDGWASGLLRLQIPEGSRSVELDLSWLRPDALRRPVEFHVKVTEEVGSVLKEIRIRADRIEQAAAAISFDLPSPAAQRVLIVESSNCYVPVNLGDSYDPRRLGVRVQNLRFVDAGNLPMRVAK